MDQVESSELSDSQMDALISGESPSRDIPMHDAKPEAQSQPQEYTIKVNGNEIKAPWEKIQTWAQLGYSHPQKMAEFNQIKAKYEEAQARAKQIEEMEQKWKPYKEVDEYASKNPEWWAQVQQSYQQRLSQAQTSPEIQEIKQQFGQVMEWMKSQQAEKQSLKMQEEDKLLASEAESIRKSFPNLDWDQLDESGKSLEMKILEHALSMGLDGSKPGHFRAAFRDFYHDQLVSKAREEGKELVSKEVQKRTKLGILGESPKPTKGLKVAENVRDKTYEELMREALAEL